MRHKVHVEVHLKDGTLLKDTVEKAQGSEDHWAPDGVIIAKFRRLAGKVLPDEQAYRLAEAVLNLDDVEDAADIARLLAPSR